MKVDAIDNEDIMFLFLFFRVMEIFKDLKILMRGIQKGFI